jgi:glycosyltransferase involved in cell wall biosynthesis/GT2 family glycosyltransferase
MALPLSIVVCTHNHAASLAATLRALAEQDADPACFEVLVVDNDCTDDTGSVLTRAGKEAPNVRVTREPTPGQAHARVRGVRESHGEWIAFVDDDNLLAQNWVTCVLHFTAKHPACGVFGGVVVIRWAEEPPAAVERRAYAYAATDLRGGTRCLQGEARWLIRGAGMVCRREALESTGWLDWQASAGRAGTGSAGGDDTEIVLRIARAGWEIWYEPACRLEHAIAVHRLSVAYLRQLHASFGAADPLLLGFRDHGSLARWAARCAALLARGLFALGRHTIRGCIDPDARLTARLTVDTLRGQVRGLRAVAALTRAERRAWLGQPACTHVRGETDEATRCRVLHLHRGRDYGGLERVLYCLGAERELAPEMEPVFGLGFRHRLATDLLRSGARVEILPSPSRRRPWLAVAAWWQLARWLRRERFDVVVCHGSSALVNFGWVARVSGVPLVLWMHTDTKQRAANLVERLAGHLRPALAICNSAFTAHGLPLLFQRPPPHVVIHCPVAPPHFPVSSDNLRNDLRAALDTSSEAVVIILPSRLQLWKGHAVLLTALGRLRDVPGWVCWIVGGPFDAEQAAVLATLQADVQRLGLAPRVRFTGQREDVPALLAAADIFCQPNLTPEPFGVNAVEALYAGLPVVASDSGGTREIVDASCGCLVPAGDAPALSEVLASLITDPIARRRLGAAAPARARVISDPAFILARLHAALAELVRSRPGNVVATAAVGRVVPVQTGVNRE